MICRQCAIAADTSGQECSARHPENCECDCQHHPVGTRQTRAWFKLYKEKND